MQPIILLITACVHAVIASKPLPSTLTRCKEDDETSMDCLKDAAQNALPFLVEGIQSLGVLSVDPLLVTEMTIARGADSPVHVALHLKNESISGLGSLTVKSVSGSTKLDSYDLHFDVFIPKFEMLGHYDAEGKILLVPLTGSGFSNLTLVDMEVGVAIKGKPVEKKGETFLEVTDFMLDIQTKRLHLYFENLFNGDKTLGPHLNSFLNENWSLIYNELKEPIEETFGAIFKDISNRIYGRVAYKNIVL